MSLTFSEVSGLSLKMQCDWMNVQGLCWEMYSRSFK